ncbi:nitrate- and nitrite sensing domain-containing protein [Actinokineospora sp. NPDC004072]
MTVAQRGKDQQLRGLTLAAVLDWRNWRLPVKLAAVLFVPVVVALAAGALQIQSYVSRSAGYAQMRDLVAVREALVPLIDSVQRERTLVARGMAEPTAYQEQGRATEFLRVRLVELRTATTGFGEVSATRFDEAVEQLAPLADVRARVAREGETSLITYSIAIKALLDFDQALVSQLGDPLLSGTATALHHIEVAREQVAVQQAVVLAGIGRGDLASADQRTLAESVLRMTDRLSDFQAVATPQQRRHFTLRMESPDVALRDRLVQSALNTSGRLLIQPAQWNRSSELTAQRLTEVGATLAAELRGTADRLQDQTSDRAGLASVVLLGMIFAAGAIGWVVGRQLLRSLNALRSAALEVADHRLPAVVAAIRANAAPDTEIEPVPVRTGDELGELARAFDKVHRQAVHSATEQAELRSDMRSIFVNLSRRSQGLVERQLKLMEELERKEEDPDQLANLFKLDHLATRMRRNNENLMVLSGTEVSRRFTKPVPLVNVLRAAVSEIEQYQRVVVHPAPPVEIVGYAAGDLVHLVAELLDNATAFSPPRTQVVVGARARGDGGVLVEIVDEGIGMAGAELAAVNRRLAEDAPAELPVSRQLGLYVVARLAARQGLRVQLRPVEGKDGLRAAVLVPPDLVRARTATPVPAAPAPSRAAAALPRKPSTPGPVSAAGLPRRIAPKPALPPVPTTPNAGGADALPRRTAGSELAGTPLGSAAAPGESAWFAGELPKRTAAPPGFGAPPPTGPRRRDPERIRGFLSSYQSGARRGAPEANQRNEQP